MPLPNRIFSIIHLAANTDFSAYTYSQVYAGAATTATINGVSVVMAAGSRLDVVLKSIAGANVYALGDPKDTFTGGVVLGGIG